MLSKFFQFDPEGVERVWRWGKETFLEKKDKDIIMKTTNGKITLYAKQRFIENRGEKPRTFWNKSKYTLLMEQANLKEYLENNLLEKGYLIIQSHRI